MTRTLIISGAQSGVDRSALDFALNYGYPCGGFCPRGRRAEDGRIPELYPLIETVSDSYVERTCCNVDHADRTLLISNGSLRGGSRLTYEYALAQQKPVLLINDQTFTLPRTHDKAFITSSDQPYLILNVAGPRASQWPRGYEATWRILEKLLNE